MGGDSTGDWEWVDVEPNAAPAEDDTTTEEAPEAVQDDTFLKDAVDPPCIFRQRCRPKRRCIRKLIKILLALFIGYSLNTNAVCSDKFSPELDQKNVTHQHTKRVLWTS